MERSDLKINWEQLAANVSLYELMQSALKSAGFVDAASAKQEGVFFHWNQTHNQLLDSGCDFVRCIDLDLEIHFKWAFVIEVKEPRTLLPFIYLLVASLYTLFAQM